MLEKMMQLAVEIIRERHPTWAVLCVTRDAITDRDEVTEDRRDVHRLPPDEVATSPGADGFEDSNPDTGAGALPGDFSITVNEHTFTFSEKSVAHLDTPEEIADLIESIKSIAARTAPPEARSEGGS